MYQVLQVLEDGRPVTLCFADSVSAHSFSRLVNAYEDDSGAGNGYSAYWPNYTKRHVRSSLWRPRGSIAKLDVGLVARMIASLYAARAAEAPTKLEDTFTITHTNNGLVFNVKDLPRRLHPTVGDMYRIPRSLSEDGMGGEGKVVEDLGGTLKVIPCWYWERDGFRSDVKIEDVATVRTMKIRDWLRWMYPERKSWEFDPKLIQAMKS